MAGDREYVFFDLGGTILDISCCYLGIERGWRKFRPSGKASAGELTRRWIEIGQILQAERQVQGPHAIFDISHEAMLAAMEELGIEDRASIALEFTRLAWDAVRQLAAPFSDAQPSVFQALRDLGYSLGIITDADQDVLHDVLPRVPSRELFAAIIGSWQAGVTKPHQQIFRYALDVCNASAENSIFVGDSTTDVPGAVAIGLFTVIVDRSGGYPGIPAPDLTIRTLTDLPGALANRERSRRGQG